MKARADREEADTAPATARTVLVVDDSRAQRLLVAKMLGRWGFTVHEAASGPEALHACDQLAPDFVISDWMMPGMNGPEFCKAFRQMNRQSYGYFILLTSKSAKEEIAEGLDAGADDFLTKPVSAGELRARLKAGERILQMEAKLVEKHRLLRETLDKLDSDLVEARKLQQSLVRERHRSFESAEVSLLLRPSGHVGGDLVGFFPISAHRLALFAIDVSGHGVASALMTARLAGYLSSTSADQNVALFEGEFGIYDAYPPEKVAAELNRLTLTELDTENYFTMVFAEIDLRSGCGRLVQAGHPHPVLLHSDGTVEHLGDGGMPIGLIQDIAYEGVDFVMRPGDRLLIASDGVTECENAEGLMLEQDGLATLLTRNAALRGPPCLEALTWDLADYAGSDEFHDDVSAVLFDYETFKKNMD